MTSAERPTQEVAPRTEAGRRLLSKASNTDGWHTNFDAGDIVAIEGEAWKQGIEATQMERAEASRSAPPAAVTDVACVHPGCGMPERLHGAPDGSRPTHSSHWYCSRFDHPHHRHGPRKITPASASSEGDGCDSLGLCVLPKGHAGKHETSVERVLEARAALASAEPCRIVVNGHGNRWCKTHEQWVELNGVADRRHQIEAERQRQADANEPEPGR